MGGGFGLALLGPWLIVAGAVCLASLAWVIRRHVPVSAESVTRLGNQITKLYAAINRANAEVASARPRRDDASTVPEDPPRSGSPERP